MRTAIRNLIVATTTGLVIVAAAAFAISPAMAGGFTPRGYNIGAVGKVVGVQWWDQLNVRKWPAWYSAPTGALAPGTVVWIERCITVENSADWCKVLRDQAYGWVNSRYLALAGQS